MATVYLAEASSTWPGSPDGGAENETGYLRVIPDWVQRMRAAVDSATP